MSRELLESIIFKNMVESNKILEERMTEIREQKLYEMKRMYGSTLYEVLGDFAPGGDPDVLRSKGYKKAAPELARREKAAAHYKLPDDESERKWFRFSKMNQKRKDFEKTNRFAKWKYRQIGYNAAQKIKSSPAKAVKNISQDLASIGTSNLN